MMRKILDAIELKKYSPSFIWKFLYKLKYYLFIIFKEINYLFLRLLFGKKIKVVNSANFRFKLFNLYTVCFSKYPFISKAIIIIKISEDKVIILPKFGSIQGEFDAVPLYFREYLPKKGDVVIDGGAYKGLFTTVLSFLVGKTGKVISFEPDSLNFEKLKNNINDYNLKNVIFVNKGLFNKNCLLLFNAYGNGSSHILGYGNGKSHISINREYKLIDINFVTIDSELKKLGIKRVNYIKMDIEGVEVKAVEGCKNTLAQNNIHFAIASYHKIKEEETHHQLEKLLGKLGYFAETCISFHTITYAHKKSNY